MENKESQKILIHVDMDSPKTLLNFYNLQHISYSRQQLETFYQLSFERMLDFFRKNNIKASLFAVGEELESSEVIRELFKDAANEGHEIENHTYTHPFGLAKLPEDEVRLEIERCSAIIEEVTGRRPIGFRSPGYSNDTFLINLLHELGFKYDSSGFWSVMNPILKLGQRFLYPESQTKDGFGYISRQLPKEPYYPSKFDWLTPADFKGEILEFPLPRTFKIGLPFYHTFNLWMPKLYAHTVAKHIQRSHLVYLMHFIEFADLSDDLPQALGIHPNIKVPYQRKLKLTQALFDKLLRRFESIETTKVVSSYEQILNLAKR